MQLIINFLKKHYNVITNKILTFFLKNIIDNKSNIDITIC